MLPIVKSQLDALVEDLRLLEILVTGPLGLYSDIKMLRESMPLPGVEDLDRDALRERRTAISSATQDAAGLAFATVDSAVSTLDTLAMLSESAGSRYRQSGSRGRGVSWAGRPTRWRETPGRRRPNNYRAST